MKNLVEKILDSDLTEKAMLFIAHVGIIACVVCLVIAFID